MKDIKDLESLLQSYNSLNDPNSTPEVMSRKPASIPEGSESSRMETIISKLKGQGMGSQEIAGVLGGLKGEVKNFDPKQKQMGGGPGYGIAQWEGPRKEQLMSTENPDTIEGQTDFLIDEMKTTEKGAKRKFEKGSTPAEVAQSFTRNFERPKTSLDAKKAGIPVSEEEMKRGEYAEEIYKDVLQPRVEAQGKMQFGSPEAEKMLEDYRAKTQRDPAAIDEAMDSPKNADFLTRLISEYQSLKDTRSTGLENDRMMDSISSITAQVGRLAPNRVDITPTNFAQQGMTDQDRSLSEMTQLRNLTTAGRGNFSNDPNSEASSRARETLKGLGIEVPAGMTEEFAAKLAPGLISTQRTRMSEQGKYNRQDKSLDFNKDKFENTKTQKYQDDASSALDSLRKTDTWKNAEKSLTEIPTIRVLLDDAYKNGGQSLAMLGPKIAKGIAGEVGVLTEQDVTRYVQNPELVGGLMDTMTKLKEGKITEVSYENLNRLLEISEKTAIDKIKEATKREALLFSRREKIPLEDAMYYLDSTYERPEASPMESYTGETKPTGSDTVLLKAPNGQTQRVKKDAVQKYLDKGATIVEE